MPNPNPYESSATIADKPMPNAPRSGKRWALVGFFLGAAIPVAFCIYSMQAEAAYRASLPESEKIMCGMGSLAALMVMVIGAPLFGAIGAMVGYALSRPPRIA